MGAMPDGCTPNEIYIVDGDRTVVLTNKAISADIEYVERDLMNYRSQISNQNQIIANLKQQLSSRGSSVAERAAKEKAHSELITQLNTALETVDKMAKENRDLSHQKNEERERRLQLETTVHQLNSKVGDLTNKLHQLAQIAEEESQNSAMFDKCKIKLAAKDAVIQSLKYDRPEECSNNTRGQCDVVRQQLELQDKAIILLKQQITAQAKSLASVNHLLTAKHNLMVNITEKLSSRLTEQHLAEEEVSGLEKLLSTQQDAIGLLRQLGAYNTYLRDARDAALKILQETVYKMVSNIDECRNAAVEGLQQRLQNLEQTQEPLNKMIKDMRKTLDATENLGSLQSYHQQDIKKFLQVRQSVLDFVQHWKHEMDEYSGLKDQVKCSLDPQVLTQLEGLYK